MNYCPKCGTELQGKFCSNCGFNTQKQPAQVPEFLVRFGRFLKENVFVLAISLFSLGCVITSIAIFTNTFRVGKVSKIKLGMTGEQVEEILGDPYLKLEGILGEAVMQEKGGEVYFWYESKAEKKLKEIDQLSLKENPSESDFYKVDELYNQLLGMDFKFIMVNFVDGEVSQVYFDKHHKYDLLDYYATAEEKIVKSLDIVGDIKYVEEWQTVDDVSTIVQRIDMDSIEYSAKFQDGSYVHGSTKNPSVSFDRANNQVKLEWKDKVAEYLKTKIISVDSNSPFDEKGVLVSSEGVTGTSVVIPDSVTSIGDSAFYDCTSLTSVVIGDSVTSIGDWAFYNCSGLTSVVIPDSVTSIDKHAFEACTNLTSVTISNSVTSIGDDAFRDCTSLTSVVIGDSVTSIGSSAFRDSTSLTSVVIPDSVTSIGYNAFYGCPIETATIPAIACEDIENSSLKTVVITSGDTIGISAFRDCTSLTSAVIPDSVTSIGAFAFYGCPIEKATIPAFAIGFIPHSNLKEIIITSGAIGNSAFFFCDSLTSVTIGDSVTSIGSCAFCGCDSLTSVVIGNSVTTIGEDAFSGCQSLTSVTIPNSVTSIGNNAFHGCDSLTSVVIPDSVTSIGYQAFYNCDSLTSVVIGDSVTTIGSSAFDSCGNLQYNEYNNAYYLGNQNNKYSVLVKVKDNSITTCTIHKDTKIIGSYAFEWCDSLTSVVIPDSVTSIGAYAFANCTSLTSVVIPDSVTTIGGSAFEYCISLTSVYITDIAAWCNIDFSVNGNQYLSANPLHYAKNLYLNNQLVTELIIPDTVTEIKAYAFYNCYNLTSVVIPNSVITIGDYAFYNCDNLTSVVIPDSVTTIGDYAFHDCNNLTSVVMGDSVTSIGDWAFCNCYNLRNVYYKGTAEEWAEISIASENYNLTDTTRYYYSESQPTEEGNYWHYDENGKPVAW